MHAINHAPAAPARTSFKVMLAGASGTGKSSLVEHLRRGSASGQHIPTLGVEVHPLALQTLIGPALGVTLKLWDLAGNPAYRGLGQGYYHGADCLVAVFDLTDVDGTLPAALEAIAANPGLPAVLVGNKALGPGALEHPSPELAEDVPFYAVSARDGSGCAEFIQDLAWSLSGDPTLVWAPAGGSPQAWAPAGGPRP